MKAILLDPASGIVASRSHGVELYSDHPGWAEADPAHWWSALAVLIPRLLDDAHASASDVAGLAVSGMVPAVLVLDRAGRPLRRAMLQNDARATTEIAELRTALGDFDMLTRSGSVLSQQSLAPSAMWVARNEPDVWARAASVCGSYDWLARELGARAHVEENWALESGLFDFDRRALVEVTEATRLTWPTFDEVASPGTLVGEVSEAASLSLGLAAGTSIVVGGADHVLSAYGAGLVNEGECLVKLGGAGDILVVSDEALVDRRLYLDRHPVPGKWLPNGCMATSGSLLRWEQSLLGGASLGDLDADASQSSPATLLALPYFLGEKTPLHDPDLRGVLLGLNLATTRGDVHRAFLEAIAYGFRSHVEVMEENGLGLGRTTVTNGGSKSRLWREILADVLNRELMSVIDHPGAAFGAAVIAGVGMGLIDDWSYVAGALSPGEVIAPRPQNTALYDQRYEEFLRLNEATASISHELARSTT